MRSIKTLLKRQVNPLIRQTAVAGLVMFMLLTPAVSPAISLSGDSSTYLLSRETADGSKILNGYEYLDFAVQNIGDETISFHTGGWLEYGFKEEDEFGLKSSSDLQYSYLSFKNKTDNSVINLGRVMVFEGVATERVDGIYARTDLKDGFGISAFGGTPVETNINLPGNDLIYGARLSHQLGDIYKIGLSVLEEYKDSYAYRKEAGVDVWVHPFDKVDITGRSTYNDITKGWMENTYALVLGPFAKLRLDTTASWINYDNYFYNVTNAAPGQQYGATTSALYIVGGPVLAGESVRILGESASYSIMNNVFVTAEYKNYDYAIQGGANYYGGTIKYSLPESGGAGIGYHCMDGSTANLRYDEYRVYGYKKIGKLDVTADVIELVYETPINGVRYSYSGYLSAQYPITVAWTIGAYLDYSHNPDYNDDTRAFLKLLYHFGSKGGA